MEILGFKDCPTELKKLVDDEAIAYELVNEDELRPPSPQEMLEWAEKDNTPLGLLFDPSKSLYGEDFWVEVLTENKIPEDKVLIELRKKQ